MWAPFAVAYLVCLAVLVIVLKQFGVGRLQKPSGPPPKPWPFSRS